MAGLVRVAVFDDPLAAACEIEGLTFTTGGDATWFSQTAETYYDNDAVQSGDIGDDETVWLQTTAGGTGTVKFCGKVSSGGQRPLACSVPVRA